MHYYRQITQNYHTFVLLGSPNVGSLMTPVFSAKLPFFSPSPTTQGFLRPSDIFLWLASHMQWQRPVPFNDGAWGGLNYVFAGNVPCCEYRDCTIKPCWIFESQWQDGTINHGVIYEIFTRYLQVYSMYTYINVSWTMPKHCNSVSEGLLGFPSQTIYPLLDCLGKPQHVYICIDSWIKYLTTQDFSQQHPTSLLHDSQITSWCGI